MGLLVDETSRSDGYHFADGPLERSPAPFGYGWLRFGLAILAWLPVLGFIAWAYWR